MCESQGGNAVHAGMLGEETEEDNPSDPLPTLHQPQAYFYTTTPITLPIRPNTESL